MSNIIASRVDRFAPCDGCPWTANGTRTCPGRRVRAICSIQKAREARADLQEPETSRPAAAPAEPPLPSPGRQVLGLLGTAGRVVAAAACGGPVLAPQEVVDERRAICRGDGRRPACGHYRTSDGRCGGATGCGCYVPLKVHLAAAQCPVGRWRRWTPEPAA